MFFFFARLSRKNATKFVNFAMCKKKMNEEKIEVGIIFNFGKFEISLKKFGKQY